MYFIMAIITITFIVIIITINTSTIAITIQLFAITKVITKANRSTIKTKMAAYSKSSINHFDSPSTPSSLQAVIAIVIITTASAMATSVEYYRNSITNAMS